MLSRLKFAFVFVYFCIISPKYLLFHFLSILYIDFCIYNTSTFYVFSHLLFPPVYFPEPACFLCLLHFFYAFLFLCENEEVVIQLVAWVNFLFTS